ncbi:hypothetical protein [Clostridium sp.]
MIRAVLIRYVMGTLGSMPIGILFLQIFPRKCSIQRIILFQIIGITCVTLPKSYEMVVYGQTPVGLLNVFGNLLYLFFTFICFKGSIWKKMLTMAAGISIAGIVEMAVVNFLISIGINTETVLRTDMGYAECVLIEGAIVAVLFYMFGIAVNHIKKRQGKGEWILILLPASIALSAAPYIWAAVNQGVGMPRYGLACYAVIIFIIMLLPVVWNEINRREETQKELLELEREYEASRLHVRQLEANAQAVRKLEHDFNNQMMVVMGMAKEGKRDEAEAMLREMEKRLEE